MNIGKVTADDLRALGYTVRVTHRTVVELANVGDHHFTAYGAALCSDDDAFDKARGERIAAGRALKDLMIGNRDQARRHAVEALTAIAQRLTWSDVEAATATIETHPQEAQRLTFADVAEAEAIAALKESSLKDRASCVIHDWPADWHQCSRCGAPNRTERHLEGCAPCYSTARDAMARNEWQPGRDPRPAGDFDGDEEVS